MNKKNLGTIREQFAQCVFNHKIYEVATERFTKYVFWIDIGNILLVSFILISLVINASLLAIGLTIIEIIYLIIQLKFNFNEKVQAYKKVALQYMSLRDRYKNLISDSMNDNLNTQTLVLLRNSYQSEYHIIATMSLQTTREDFNETQRRLNTEGDDDEDFTWSDSEINKFLPKDLRIGEQ